MLLASCLIVQKDLLAHLCGLHEPAQLRLVPTEVIRFSNLDEIVKVLLHYEIWEYC